MSVRTIHNTLDAVACLYDSTTGEAFGPVFTGLDANDQATHFVWWVETQEYDPPLQDRCDIRQFTPKQIMDFYGEWREKFTDPEHGELNAAAATRVVKILA